MAEDALRWECWKPLGGCGRTYKSPPQKKDARGRAVCPACGEWAVECRIMRDLSGPSATVGKTPARGRDGQYVA